MATNSLARALVPSHLSLLRHSLLSYKKINLHILSRNIHYLSRCNFSSAATQVKEVDEATEKSDSRKTKIPVLGEFENRNPRNEEYFGFNKPRGYSTQVYRVDFYNKLKFLITNRHTRAQVVHNSGFVLVSASTTEFEITRHLYKTTDVTAARNIGRVIAQRCLEAGITRVRWETKKGDLRKQRTTAFSEALKEGGVILSEPKKVIPPETYYLDFRPKKKRKKWRKLPYSKRWKAHLNKPK
ncbi:39S ribosomal protein L18, mitochondrial-like [Stylophora pistillata]|uniref:Large ribosomal subunit protein uL18m n=1 Tax=Stylophora pistillata TaxID=50429 RepID=A0A2B4RUI2_STYPI|nr:39S ribosomal protein L18, mitochondrial-like [Stylophora pistillata]PFX20453.1 39S ribosomal protein L18, mitochondrial [Stylophora pistillata]